MFDSYSYSSQKQSQSQSVHVEAQKSNNYDVYDLGKIKEALEGRLELMENLENNSERIINMHTSPSIEDFKNFLREKGEEFAEVSIIDDIWGATEHSKRVKKYLISNGYRISESSTNTFYIEKDKIKNWLEDVKLYSDGVENISREKIEPIYPYLFGKWKEEDYSVEMSLWNSMMEEIYKLFKMSGVYATDYSYRDRVITYVCTQEDFKKLETEINFEDTKVVSKTQEQKDDDTVCVGIIAAIIGVVVGIFFALLLL